MVTDMNSKLGTKITKDDKTIPKLANEADIDIFNIVVIRSFSGLGI
jgi:hypothetical protein